MTTGATEHEAATIRASYLDRARLAALAAEHGRAYRTAEPFPHVVIDDFVAAEDLDEVLREFPAPGDIVGRQGQERKIGISDEEQLGPFSRHYLAQFNSAAIIEFLEELTGIEGLVGDPRYVGGGLHQTLTGGFLKVHADFNWHKQLKLDRRLNLILFLNRDWQEEYGGRLELWDREMSTCVESVLPVFNRCVVFNTTDWSYHGHPEPLTCPEGVPRRSMALYYYSNGRPAEEVSESHSTLFKARPGEVMRREANLSGGRRARVAARRLMPASLVRALRGSRGR